MTTKEWLKRGWKLDREIQQLIEARDEAFAAATSTTCGTEGEKIQASQKNASEAKIIRYTAYTEQIDKRIDEGDTIVLRGKGKAVLTELSGLSKKGRIWAEFKVFI